MEKYLDTLTIMQSIVRNDEHLRSLNMKLFEYYVDRLFIKGDKIKRRKTIISET